MASIARRHEPLATTVFADFRRHGRARDSRPRSSARRSPASAPTHNSSPAAIILGACVWMFACSSPIEPASVASTSSPAIYGTDDRVDVYQEQDPLVRDLAIRSIAALVFQNRVTV